MANLVKFYFNTEAKILALTPSDEEWVELAFYYPSDKSYFYQAVAGVMKVYGYTPVGDTGIGVTLNNKVIGGVKEKIEGTDILDIPEHYEYNCVNLHVQGTINCKGTINILG